jgi:DNA polymerase/3'-5' exonuclease PolX
VTDLFGNVGPVYPIISILRDGEKSGDWRIIKGREKYFQLALAEGINLDLFLVTPPAQWGVDFVLRTGPADFNKWAVTSRRKGGGLPSNAVMHDAGVYVNNKLVPMPEEIDFLNFLGLGWLEPGERAARWFLLDNVGRTAYAKKV